MLNEPRRWRIVLWNLSLYGRKWHYRSVKAPEIWLDWVTRPPITGIQNKASLEARRGNRSDSRRECLAADEHREEEGWGPCEHSHRFFMSDRQRSPNSCGQNLSGLVTYFQALLNMKGRVETLMFYICGSRAGPTAGGMRGCSWELIRKARPGKAGWLKGK